MSHPYLHEPILYISNLAPHVSDVHLARAFEFCVPFRPEIHRDDSGQPLSGIIMFKEVSKAEKALATLNNRTLPVVTPPAIIHLSVSSPPQPLPPPQAQPRLIKHLPFNYNDALLYDLCRPFGSLASVRANFADGAALVEYYFEDDARIAENSLHCAEVGGSSIVVQVYHPRRAPGVNPNATAFVPGSYQAQQYSPPPGYPRQPPSFVHGPGQQVQFAPVHGPGANSHSGLIDPCNLFCKNLDPEIDSNGLFNNFRRFGHIVSARVMRNETGQSRGFGFVSFQTPDQAAAAMQAMNGATFGSKQIVVRLHEPKQLRQEKLAHRFGNSPLRTGSGATSPTPSEGGESYWGRSSPGGPVSPSAQPERVRRGSGSYYNAALTGNLNLPMQVEDLAALSTVVRREVLTGELTRRIKELPNTTTTDTEIDSVLDSLLELSLKDIVDGIQHPTKLAEQVQYVKSGQKGGQTNESVTRLPSQPPTKPPSPANSQDSRLLDPNATASAPEHPSTPVSLSASISTPPRTSSPSGSIAVTAAASEKERLMAAVSRIEPRKAAEITDLLMSLSKRERALCLFNSDVLKTKVAEAIDVLTVVSVEDEPQKHVAPATPALKRAEDAPRTPELSSRGASAAASPGSPQTPVTISGAQIHTLASLARLSAIDIVNLANSPTASSTGLPLPRADPLIMQQTNQFIDGLQDKAPYEQKQLLGEKLFRVVKSFGVKGAPKATIALLDKEDLRALAHLMNSYPAVLKEKVLQDPLVSGNK